jgi:predicted phosphodiesterase
MTDPLSATPTHPGEPFDWAGFSPRRIFFCSDIHAEMHPWSPPADAGPGDLLLLAGDIHTKSRAASFAESLGLPCVFLAGNHDHYGANLPGSLATLSSGGFAKTARLLERSELRMGRLRILGCTLWTDYALRGNPGAARSLCQARLFDKQAPGMTDHLKIRTGDYRKCRARDFEAEHAKAIAFLRQALAAPFEGATIIATHHAPSSLALDGIGGDPDFDPAYASALDEFAASSGAAFWIHGHTHRAARYGMGACAGLCNPRGYPGEATGYRERAHLLWDGAHLSGPFEFDLEDGRRAPSTNPTRQGPAP